MMAKMRRLLGPSARFHPLHDHAPACRGHSWIDCRRPECWDRATGYGIALGGFVGIDFNDSKVTKVHRELLDQVQTTTVKTPRGLHLYLRGELESGGFSLKDHRGRERFSIRTGPGAYLVGPGSRRTDGGTYRLVSGKCPPADSTDPGPGRLLLALHDYAGEHRPSNLTGGGVRVLEAGVRIDGLTSMALAMMRAGFDQKTVEQALRDHNARHCKPPLTEEELESTMLGLRVKWRE